VDGNENLYLNKFFGKISPLVRVVPDSPTTPLDFGCSPDLHQPATISTQSGLFLVFGEGRTRLRAEALKKMSRLKKIF
jgi:hypothetical protein